MKHGLILFGACLNPETVRKWSNLFIFFLMKGDPAFNLHKPPLVFQCLAKNPKILFHILWQADPTASPWRGSWKKSAFCQVNTSRQICADWDLVKRMMQPVINQRAAQKNVFFWKIPNLFQGFTVNGLITMLQFVSKCYQLSTNLRILWKGEDQMSCFYADPWIDDWNWFDVRHIHVPRRVQW